MLQSGARGQKLDTPAGGIRASQGTFSSFHGGKSRIVKNYCKMSCNMRKPSFCIHVHCENKGAQMIAFVFASQIVQSLYFLNASHLLQLYSLVCVGNPEDRFSHIDNLAHLLDNSGRY